MVAEEQPDNLVEYLLTFFKKIEICVSLKRNSFKMDILIFKTNINCKKKLKTVRKCLAQLIGIKEWTVDLNDCDFVLRIVANDLSMDEVEKCISAYGFEISAL